MTDLAVERAAEAKAMFFAYACRTFFMAHDSAATYTRYVAFGISESLEREWCREYIGYWVARLSTDDLTAVNHLRDAEAAKALPNLLSMAGKGDSYAKLWYANAIWDIAERTRIPAALRDEVARTTVELWLSIIEGPVALSDDHRQLIGALISKGALDAAKAEEYVQNYARRRLAKLDPNRR